MIDFSETRLDIKWGVGSTGGPEFNTTIVISSSGYEYSNSNWAQDRYRYDIGNRLLGKAEKDYLMAFFKARRGKGQGFRFKDYSDFKATSSLIGLGTGTATQFQLYKNYTVNSDIVNRKIVKPVNGTLALTVNGGAPGTNSVNYSTGIVTFTTPPANGHEVRATFEFDVPVRFDVDKFELEVLMVNDSKEQYQLHSLPIVELRL